MSNIIATLEKERMQREVPDFGPGDTVVVEVKVKEGDRERVQAYEGVVIAKSNRGFNSSFTDGLLDWPHYTRPEAWEGRPVPPVLLGGNHAAIDRWRRKQALGSGRALSAEDDALLQEYLAEREVKDNG